jgi:hypothetical protein
MLRGEVPMMNSGKLVNHKEMAHGQGEHCELDGKKHVHPRKGYVTDGECLFMTMQPSTKKNCCGLSRKKKQVIPSTHLW